MSETSEGQRELKEGARNPGQHKQGEWKEDEETYLVFVARGEGLGADAVAHVVAPVAVVDIAVRKVHDAAAVTPVIPPRTLVHIAGRELHPAHT